MHTLSRLTTVSVSSTSSIHPFTSQPLLSLGSTTVEKVLERRSTTTIVVNITFEIDDSGRRGSRGSPSGPEPLLSALKCKNEYLVLALGEETAVDGSIVWAFCRVKNPRSREMSALRYAL